MSKESSLQKKERFPWSISKLISRLLSSHRRDSDTEVTLKDSIPDRILAEEVRLQKEKFNSSILEKLFFALQEQAKESFQINSLDKNFFKTQDTIFQCNGKNYVFRQTFWVSGGRDTFLRISLIPERFSREIENGRNRLQNYICLPNESAFMLLAVFEKKLPQLEIHLEIVERLSRLLPGWSRNMSKEDILLGSGQSLLLLIDYIAENIISKYSPTDPNSLQSIIVTADDVAHKSEEPREQKNRLTSKILTKIGFSSNNQSISQNRLQKTYR